MGNLGNYGFLSWYKKGIGNYVTEQENFGNIISNPVKGRPELKAFVDLASPGAPTVRFERTLQFIGPGEVMGIDRRMIVRTEPANGINDFEPTYLPFIEFYEEDFLWRHTPAKPRTDAEKDKLRPWLLLLVLENSATNSEFTIQVPSVSRPVPILELNDPSLLNTIVHPPSQHWAWAHVQFLDATNINAGTAKNVIDTRPDNSVCRLVSSRKLKINTSYTAFVVPAFETGRRAGRGDAESDIQGVIAQEASWGQNQSEFPIYHQWNFNTGSEGDFEKLVGKLEPLNADSDLGTREMDITSPGYGLEAKVSGTGLVHLEGALAPPTFTHDPILAKQGGEGFATHLADLTNYSFEQQAETSSSSYIDFATFLADEYPNVFVDPSSIDDDPVVAPPTYGQWYAMVKKVSPFELDSQNEPTNILTTDWVHKLNTDVRYRAVAGIGAKVVRSKQEELMEEAWKQIGEVNAANNLIRQAELAKLVNKSIFEKHVLSSSEEKRLQLYSKSLGKISSSNGTFLKDLTDSAMPNASVDSGFKKISRANSPINKRLKLAQMTPIDQKLLLSGLSSNTTITAAPVLATPVESDPVGIVTAAVNDENTVVNTSNPPNSSSEYGSAYSSFNQGNALGNIASQVSVFTNTVNTAYTDIANLDPKPALTLSTTVPLLQNKISPANAISERLKKKLSVLGGSNVYAEANKPIMAYPKFTEPMYADLLKLSSDYLVPNLGQYPNNIITVLKTNRAFIESYMMGLNHEMGRELLWREYPTDQRGSYFRQFWNVTDNGIGINFDPDIKELHLWQTNNLGANHEPSRFTTDESDQAVLLIRGDLLRKYPNVLVYAQRAAFQTDGANQPMYTASRLLAPSDPSNIVFPIFKAGIGSDVQLLGFDFTINDAKGDIIGPSYDPGWFFVFRERPGQIRFGLDDDVNALSGTTLNSWDDLAWQNLGNPESIDLNNFPSGPAQPNPLSSSASLASILFQKPVKVAFHASDMLHNI